MNASPLISVILPAYNEALNLQGLLPQLHAVLRPIVSDYEILVIDRPMPGDDSVAICSEQGAHYYTANEVGYGSALRMGIGLARGQHILVMDADGSHPVSLIPALYEAIQHADMVIASRYVQGGKTHDTQLNIMLSKLLNGMVRLLFVCPIKDVSSSFRMYDGGKLRGLSLNARHFNIPLEILFRMQKTYPDCRIVEVPMEFQKRRQGISKRSYVVFARAYASTLFTLMIERYL